MAKELTDNTLKLLTEAINLEKNVGELYSLFQGKLGNQHKAFWFKLSIEEGAHASLLESFKNLYPHNLIPDSAIYQDISKLQETNSEVRNWIDKYNDEKAQLNEEEAFNIALMFEKSAGEKHYDYLKKITDKKFSKIIEKLANDDDTHHERIAKYMKKHNIPFNPQPERLTYSV